jgi:aconitate hydratase
MLDVRQRLQLADKSFEYYSLPMLAKQGFAKIARLPVSIRIVLESLLRNRDGVRIGDDHIAALAGWQAKASRESEVPFVVGRVLLQDFTGVPLLVDLAAMRSAVERKQQAAAGVRPHIPVDLVIDHSVQVDAFGFEGALRLNIEMEFRRNRERYQFLKWGEQAFDGLRIVPPGFGICHQVNLESLAQGVLEKDGVLYPDTLVGTDSHTTMINGLGIVGWGVGGIEAEAAMLGEPIYFLAPDVVGVCLSGELRPGVTATDLVLHITQLLRGAKVVGKFVEFHGPGASTLSVADRATIGNMSPEYGATIGYFPVDEQSCRYLAATGRSEQQVDRFRSYFQAQELFGMPARGDCDYSTLIDLDLAEVEPSVAGPKRPQDRIPLGQLKTQFQDLLARKDATGFAQAPDSLGKRVKVRIDMAEAAYPGGGDQERRSANANRDTNALTEAEMMDNRPTPDPDARPRSSGTSEFELGHGSVVIAAITSCTNTSNPQVMLAAGLLAKKAVKLGLQVPNWVKTSLAPGSPVVREYLEKTGLLPYLERLGFYVVGFGCTTCIGNSGPLARQLEDAVRDNQLVVASVLSGNRNFEARIHQSVKANFLMSPPLVVAYALAGRVDIDLDREPLGRALGKDVYLRDLWPSPSEIGGLLPSALDPEAFRRAYADAGHRNELWNQIPVTGGTSYAWQKDSSYIREPPYFTPPLMAAPKLPLRDARALAIFGDSITTDHISPAGTIDPKGPAGAYLRSLGVEKSDFNSYGSRRGNHEVMVRGTFANVRIRNTMLPDSEGGVTLHQPSGEQLSIFDAAARYEKEGVPLIVFAGQDYGSGSSRDWAAKGTRLLGVRAVVAVSFERIHRSNLVGMGVLPCQFAEGQSPSSLKLDGSEQFSLSLQGELRPRQSAQLEITRRDGKREQVKLTLRLDSPIELEYLKAGGILPYVLRQFSGDLPAADGGKR